MTEAKEKPKGNAGSAEQIAVVRIRGSIRVAPAISSTLDKLNLQRVNYATIIPNTPSMQGMLKKAKDYLTWGDASTETVSALKKRAEPNPKDPKKKKNFMKLHPPRGGYGRKGIKKTFSQSGGSGDRKEKINDLIKRML